MFWIVGASIGSIILFLARKTPPIKALINASKRVVTKSQMGQSIILSNAKDTIRNEFEREVEKLNEERQALQTDEKILERKKDYVELLQRAINEEELSNEERGLLTKELDLKRTEINILVEAIKQKSCIVEQMEVSLKDYSTQVLDKRLVEAELAEVAFHQERKLRELQGKLAELGHLGETSMTSLVVQKYTTSSTEASSIPIGRRYQILNKYRES